MEAAPGMPCAGNNSHPARLVRRCRWSWQRQRFAIAGNGRKPHDSVSCERPGVTIALNRNLVEQRSDSGVVSLKEITMKVTTIALATALTLTSSLALAQTTGTEGYGSVAAPSVGFDGRRGGG